AGVPIPSAIAFGAMTATFGGIIRDIIAGDRPMVLWSRDFYVTAAALYLYHREKELDEYERLLFSDDYEDDDYDDEDSTTYENIPSAPAEEKE
ncbi:MAG TPA: TRIC cation channel family protein, partial [Gemmiger formicilis]|nr:TRIC cation channel family protein [Gemmiger formicilis]